MTESQHYEYWANYYAGEAILLKCHASVHVEAFDDAVFWEKTFNHFLPEQKFNFVYHSLSLTGKETTGCVQCLKYKDYLSERFFICIDSDYRYLLQEHGINASNYIYQTYTYSIENHLCYASKLNVIQKKCTGVAHRIFDFEAFLLSYSQAIYEAFIWHLHFLRNGDQATFNKGEFNGIISLNGMTGFSIENNGEAIINQLTTRSTSKVTLFQAQHPDIDIEADKAHFRTLGVTPDNAYLFVRGHNLFDLVVKIGIEVNNKVLRIEAARLENKKAIAQLYDNSTPFKRELEREILFTGYEGIERVGREIIVRL